MHNTLLLVVLLLEGRCILGLPDFNSNSNNNNNANDNSNTSAPEPTPQQTTANGSSTTTYKNSAFGFTIERPSDWEIRENDVTPFKIDENTKYPALAVYDAVSFSLKNKNVTDTGAYADMKAQASLMISPLNLAKYLDVNDLKIKTKSYEGYANHSRTKTLSCMDTRIYHDRIRTLSIFSSNFCSSRRQGFQICIEC
jgi:hypothetical protein